MSSDNDSSLKNQNMCVVETLNLHMQVYDYLKNKRLNFFIKFIFLYISMPNSDLEMTKKIDYTFSWDSFTWRYFWNSKKI